MIIFKYTILLLIFLLVSIIGNLVSKKYKNRVEELKDFKEFCNILESKIKFTYEPLGEVFEEIIEIVPKKMKEILKCTSTSIKEKGFKKAWENSIDIHRGKLNLKDEDINIIKKLSNMLGKTDIAGQISEINLTMDFLDTQIKEAEFECRKNEKLYKSLGTIVGLSIVIILI